MAKVMFFATASANISMALPPGALAMVETPCTQRCTLCLAHRFPDSETICEALNPILASPAAASWRPRRSRGRRSIANRRSFRARSMLSMSPRLRRGLVSLTSLIHCPLLAHSMPTEPSFARSDFKFKKELPDVWDGCSTS